MESRRGLVDRYLTSISSSVGRQLLNHLFLFLDSQSGGLFCDVSVDGPVCPSSLLQRWRLTYRFDSVLFASIKARILNAHSPWTACFRIPHSNRPSIMKYIIFNDALSEYEQTRRLFCSRSCPVGTGGTHHRTIFICSGAASQSTSHLHDVPGAPLCALRWARPSAR